MSFVINFRFGYTSSIIARLPNNKINANPSQFRLNNKIFPVVYKLNLMASL